MQFKNDSIMLNIQNRREYESFIQNDCSDAELLSELTELQRTVDSLEFELMPLNTYVSDTNHKYNTVRAEVDRRNLGVLDGGWIKI